MKKMKKLCMLLAILFVVGFAPSMVGAKMNEVQAAYTEYGWHQDAGVRTSL